MQKTETLVKQFECGTEVTVNVTGYERTPFQAAAAGLRITVKEDRQASPGIFVLDDRNERVAISEVELYVLKENVGDLIDLLQEALRRGHDEVWNNG